MTDKNKNINSSDDEDTVQSMEDAIKAIRAKKAKYQREYAKRHNYKHQKEYQRKHTLTYLLAQKAAEDALKNPTS